MAQIKKISATLSVAATVLLEACSSSGRSDSGPAPVANTTAPQLVGTWQTDCIVTQNSGSTTTTTGHQAAVAAAFPVAPLLEAALFLTRMGVSNALLKVMPHRTVMRIPCLH